MPLWMVPVMMTTIRVQRMRRLTQSKTITLLQPQCSVTIRMRSMILIRLYLLPVIHRLRPHSPLIIGTATETKAAAAEEAAIEAVLAMDPAVKVLSFFKVKNKIQVKIINKNNIVVVGTGIAIAIVSSNIILSGYKRNISNIYQYLVIKCKTDPSYGSCMIKEKKQQTLENLFFHSHNILLSGLSFLNNKNGSLPSMKILILRQKKESQSLSIYCRSVILTQLVVFDTSSNKWISFIVCRFVKFVVVGYSHPSRSLLQHARVPFLSLLYCPKRLELGAKNYFPLTINNSVLESFVGWEERRRSSSPITVNPSN